MVSALWTAVQSQVRVLLYVHVFGSNGLATMPGAKWSAGVAPEVNLRNPLHAVEEPHKWGGGGIHSPWLFASQGKRHQKSKTGINGLTKRLMSPQKFEKSQFRSICQSCHNSAITQESLFHAGRFNCNQFGLRLLPFKLKSCR